jgi:hypothetical protein
LLQKLDDLPERLAKLFQSSAGGDRGGLGGPGGGASSTEKVLGAAGAFIPGLGELANFMRSARELGQAWDQFRQSWSGATPRQPGPTTPAPAAAPGQPQQPGALPQVPTLPGAPAGTPWPQNPLVSTTTLTAPASPSWHSAAGPGSSSNPLSGGAPSAGGRPTVSLAGSTSAAGDGDLAGVMRELIRTMEAVDDRMAELVTAIEGLDDLQGAGGPQSSAETDVGRRAPRESMWQAPPEGFARAPGGRAPHERVEGLPGRPDRRVDGIGEEMEAIKIIMQLVGGG